MRRQLITAIAGLALAANAAAADFGIRAGASLATLKGSDVAIDNVDPAHRLGFTGGVFVTLPAGDRFAIQPEVVFTQKGAKYEDPRLGDMRLRLNYIEVPVLLVFRLGGEEIRPSLLAGGMVGYKLSATARRQTDGSSEEEKIGDEMKDLDLGIVGGIAFDIPVADKELVIDVRYTRGLRTTDDTSPDPVDHKTSTFAASFGVRF